MSAAPMQNGEAVPVPAATVLLVRDAGPGIEVFMMQRPAEMSFAGGALVFPGGKVDPQDRDAALMATAAGLDGLDEFARVLRVAVIRETFEEAGVLLARRRGEAQPVDAGTARELAARFQGPVVRGEVPFLEVLRAGGLELAADLLAPFAHWVTPRVRPKRFDTHFFLAPLPPGQEGVHDGHESTDSVWIAPADAVRDAEAGLRPLMFPTRANLDRLSESATVGDAIARALATPVVPIRPEAETTPEGEVVRIPEGVGYRLTRMVNRGPWTGRKPA